MLWWGSESRGTILPSSLILSVRQRKPGLNCIGDEVEEETAVVGKVATIAKVGILAGVDGLPAGLGVVGLSCSSTAWSDPVGGM